ncbi:hypothetical protein AURDEDRAFT_167392 [Auricularia subglabra TFB-10046 SS5]|nr:hypothetical protein AURDEDRAFT_167392 [Auricularia subglabra TFB-10046 SS5]
MLFASFVIAALSAVEVSAALGKPALFTNGLGGPLKKLDTLWRAPTVSRSSVAVPQICKDHAKDAGCNVNNVVARRVQYNDCAQSWVLCKCGESNMSMDTIEARFARVPVGIRSYVGGVLAQSASGCSAANYNGQFIRFKGDCGVSVFLHESGHSVDKGMSNSQAFKNAVAADTCVPDDYSNASYAEDWTQNNVCLTYTNYFEPLKNVAPRDPSCMHRQIDLLRKDARIAQSQATSKCLTDKRPFLLRKRDLEEHKASFATTRWCTFNNTVSATEEDALLARADREWA